jgi:type IV secretory pathway VirB2 component (pilin)
MRHPGGRWVIGIVGLIVVIVGVVLVIEGVRRKFAKQLQTSQMSARTRRIVLRLGTIGTAARGLVFALAGALVIEAAAKSEPSKARGLDKALRTLRDQPYGKVALFAAALGLIIFGVYGLCEARWRRV